MLNQNYFLKIIILFIATLAGIFIIWYALVRQESVDWISSQALHQVSPYAITVADNGRVIIDNVIIGYGFSLPPGFKTTGARNFSFFKEEDGRKKCEIKHYYLNTDKARGLAVDEARLIIPASQQKLVFELAGTETEKNLCAKYLKQIEASIVEN